MNRILKQARQFLKQRFDSINNKRLKKNILNALPFWLGAFICGCSAVLYAKLFSIAESGTHLLYEKAKWVFFIVTPACFLIARYLVVRYAAFARGSGIPQVSAAIELSNPKYSYTTNALLSIRIVLIKVISSLIMAFSGGVLGREGPTIQIAASIFKKINDLLPEWYPKISKRNMIITGAASGLAAAFNTPLGGIVFAIEELTKTHFSFFKSALLTGVIIAGLSALNFSGPYLYLGYPHLANINAWIILPIVPLAIITGVAGSGMGAFILYVLNQKRRLKKTFQQLIYTIICGLIIASLGVLVDEKIFGSGKEIMVTTLFTDDKHLIWHLPLLRIIGSVVTFTVGGAGGIFAPSLTSGASIGAVFAGLLHQTPEQTNLLILCGMTGFLTSVTRSPFTSSILVLEMTNSHNVIFFIMLTALLSNIVANIISKHTFYDYLKDQFIREIHQTQLPIKDVK